MRLQKRIVSCLCAIAVSASFFPLTMPASAKQNASTFYEDLAQLLSEQDATTYFDSMTLTIGSKDLIVDGTTVRMDVAPDIQNNRTMLPIRAVAEAAGASVDYEPETSTAIIEGMYSEEILCPIGASTMSVNAQTYQLDSPSYAKDGRTYLPVRAVSEALNFNVEWDQDTSTVTITAPYQTARVLVWSKKLNTSGLDPRVTLHDGDWLWVLQFDTPAEAANAVELLSSKGYDAEPDYYIPPFDEEYEVETYSMQSSHYSWGVADCGFDTFVAKYKDKFTQRGIVAVLDTGVDATHPFLKGKVLSGKDLVDNSSTQDPNGHGTYVSGTIIDCVGDAPVSILPVRVMRSDGKGSTSTIAAGVIYAAREGADVINLSLSGPMCGSVDFAIEYAIQQGATVVAAAANKNTDTIYYCPAHIDIPGMVVASAGDSSHAKADFSNYGNSVDLMAPGVLTKATAPGGGFATVSGTSIASPHAAAAAILLDLVWGKTLSPAGVEAKVHSATTNGRWINQYIGYGFLDMRNADVPATVPPITPPSEDPTTPPSEGPTTPPSEGPTTPPSEEPTTPPSEDPTAPPFEDPTTPPSEDPTTPPSKDPTPPPPPPPPATWQNQGWTMFKPQESDTLKITDIRTVVDSEGYTEYTYYHYWGRGNDGLIYMSYGNAFWKNYEEITSRDPYKYSKTYDGSFDAYNAPGGTPTGTVGNIWWLKSTKTIPTATHVEYRYSILKS